jgi:heterodisulfide reductase subunit B
MSSTVPKNQQGKLATRSSKSTGATRKPRRSATKNAAITAKYKAIPPTRGVGSLCTFCTPCSGSNENFEWYLRVINSKTPVNTDTIKVVVAKPEKYCPI